MPKGGRLSTGSRLPADDLDELLTCWRYKPLGRARSRPDHQCRRAALSRSQTAHQTGGRLLRLSFDGLHLVRGLQSRKPKPGRQHSSPADTNLWMLPRLGEVEQQSPDLTGRQKPRKSEFSVRAHQSASFASLTIGKLNKEVHRCQYVCQRGAHYSYDSCTVAVKDYGDTREKLW